MSDALFEAVYRGQPEEHAFRVTRVTGAIPADLSGTFLRSGPGLLQIGADHLNFFDGHALIAGVSFADGQATFRSRFVRTKLYEEELAKGGMAQRRVFTNLPTRWSNLFALSLGNNAMHDVYAWGAGDALRVVAGNDPGHHALDPRTLETRGRETWGGAVAKGEEMAPMPVPDPASGRLVAWTKRVGGTRPDALRFVELDEDFRVVKETPWHPLAASPLLVHDQRATPRWYVATEQALRLSPLRALWGASTVWEAFRSPPGATATLLLAPREGAGPLVRVPLPAPLQIAFHVINAFDDGDRVVVDLVTYGGRIRFSAAAARPLREKLGLADAHGPRPTPMRFVVDPAAGRLVSAARIGEVTGEVPEVADAVMGRPYRTAYLTSPSDDRRPDVGGFMAYDALTKLDVETGAATTWKAEGALVSPCAFVARPNATAEDDGWLLAWLLREGETSVAVLDARALEAGPVATLDLGVHLPGTNHTRWAAGVHLEA